METSLPDRTGSLGASPYADPREIEHPLVPMDSLRLTRLAWVQPRLMHPAYELWGGESVVATLRFQDLQRREALGASAEQLWVLRDSLHDREVFEVLQRGVRTAAFGTDEDGRGSLRLPDGRRLIWVRRPFLRCAFALVDLRGHEVVRFEDRSQPAGRVMVTFSTPAAVDADAAFLAVAGMYLSLSTATPGTRGSGREREA